MVQEFISRLARIQITPEIIVEALKLPQETRIIGCIEFAGLIELKVEHPDLPELKHGDKIPLIKPIYKKIEFNWGIGE